jgi:hypothetical protein
VSGVILRDCHFRDTASWAIYARSGSFFIDQMTFDAVTCTTAARGGSMLLGSGVIGANLCTFLRCNFNGPGFGTYGADALQRGAVHLTQSANLEFLGCGFQSLGAGTAISFAGIHYNHQFRDCHMETSTSSGSADKHWITVGGPAVGVLFDGCHIKKFNTAVGTLLLKVGATTGNILAWAFSNCGFFTDKTVDNATDDVVLATAADSVVFINSRRAHFASGTVKPLTLQGPTTGVGRLLTDNRIRIPGLATGDITALLSPLAGDLAYDTTTNTLKFYNGTTWGDV